jgi:hypothetical protein
MTNRPVPGSFGWQWSAVCPQCGIEFSALHNTGRNRIYCSRNCRQRAYESRRALGSQLLPIRPSDRQFSNKRPLEPAYHKGWIPGRLIEHAVVYGVFDERWFRSLCGAMVLPMQKRFFPGWKDACKVCSVLVEKYPPPTPLRSFVDALRNEEVERRATTLATRQDGPTRHDRLEA